MKIKKGNLSKNPVISIEKTQKERRIQDMRINISKELNSIYQDLDSIAYLSSIQISQPLVYFFSINLIQMANEAAFARSQNIRDKRLKNQSDLVNSLDSYTVMGAHLLVLSSVLLLPSILTRKAFAPLFNFFFPLEHFLTHDFLGQQANEDFLIKKDQELKKKAFIIKFIQNFIIFIMVTIPLFYIGNLIVFRKKTESDPAIWANDISQFIQLASLFGYYIFKDESLSLQSPEQKMQMQLQQFLFRSTLEWQITKDVNDKFQSLLLVCNTKKISFTIDNKKYQVSTKKFFSELAILLYKMGYFPFFEENRMSILSVKVIAHSQYSSALTLLKKHLIELGSIAEFKANKLIQLNDMTASLDSTIPKWQYFKLVNTETNLPEIRFVTDVALLSNSQREFLIAELSQLFGHQNIVCIDNHLTVIGWQLINYKLLRQYHYHCSQFKLPIKDNKESSNQSSQPDKINSASTDYKAYLSFWMSKKSNQNCAKPKATTKNSNEDNHNEEFNENNNNNDDVKIQRQLEILKERYGPHVTTHKAVWLPKNKVYFGVVNPEEIHTYIDKKYKKIPYAHTEFNHCIDLKNQSDDTFIKSNNPKNHDKSHNTGLFSSGAELVSDIKGKMRLFSFKVKHNNARLQGYVTEKEIKGEKILVIKFRGFDPNYH